VRGLWPVGIRARLGLTLVLALLPVLLLSVVQAVLAFQGQAQAQRTRLTTAAVESAAVARARIEAAEVLLQTLAPGSVGFECAQRLSEVETRLKGYENLIRFGPDGRLACAAGSVPADPLRVERPWFRALAEGAPLVVTSNPGPVGADGPLLLAAVPARADNGGFEGAFAAVMNLESLRPETSDPTLPAGSEVAIADAQGHWLSSTDLSRFPRAPTLDVTSGAAQVWAARDALGRARLFAAAPLVGREVFVALSAPDQGLVSWAWVNPVSALALPVVAFTLALGAVWAVADRGVVRWITYLQRIAAIYARGRFSVRPVKADLAPTEIRDLADTLGDMAATIVARDAALVEHLKQKDAMLLEIHHRVKNNLQIISSLLNMQQRALTDRSARTAISDTRQRISALALIYRALYQSPDLRRVDLREFLEELVGQLVSGEGDQWPGARTDLACEPLVIDPDRLAPIALFAVEAVSNACKHGLEPGGVLSVTFHVSDGAAELVISDSGVAGRPPRLGVGVGRTLMTAFARQLRGEATFKANAAGGLTVALVFPLPESLATPSAPRAEEARTPRAASA